MQATMRQKNKSRGAYTLAEVMISITIVAVGLSIFCTTLSMSAKTTDVGRRQMQAMNYAREEIEMFRTYAFNDPRLLAGTYPITNAAYTGTNVVSDITTNDRKMIRVQVTWTNVMSKKLTNVTYVTQMCKALH